MRICVQLAVLAASIAIISGCGTPEYRLRVGMPLDQAMGVLDRVGALDYTGDRGEILEDPPPDFSSVELHWFLLPDNTCLTFGSGTFSSDTNVQAIGWLYLGETGRGFSEYPSKRVRLMHIDTLELRRHLH